MNAFSVSLQPALLEPLTKGGWEWTKREERRLCSEDREVQEAEHAAEEVEEEAAEEGGQGHSCDKEGRMKDVASVER